MYGFKENDILTHRDRELYTGHYIICKITDTHITVRPVTKAPQYNTVTIPRILLVAGLWEHSSPLQLAFDIMESYHPNLTIDMNVTKKDI